MRIELLWWEGCPSYPEALHQLRDILDEEGVLEEVDLVQVHDDEQARRERFQGSPTIRMDGEDLFPPGEGEGEPYSLTCRVYRLGDGRISPTPDPEHVRQAVRRRIHDAADR